MDRAPIDRELLRKLDACRTGTADHKLPEVRESLASALDGDEVSAVRDDLARIDRAIVTALHDAPIPPGLADRLKAALAEAAAAAEPALHADSGVESIPLRRGAPRRRRWMAGTAAAVLACAASVLVAWFVWPATVIDLGPEAIMNVALAATQQPATEHATRVSAVAPPARYGAGQYILSGTLVEWHRLAGSFLQRDGVAYQLVGRHRERASLFVVDLHGPLGAPQIGPLPETPSECVLTTAGCTSAVWSDGQRLFVLVVEGDAGALRAFIHEPNAIA